MSDGQSQPHAHEGERYWNEEGGRTWVANIDQIDALTAQLSAISVDHAMPQEGEVVLDVGCGGGATSRAMAERVGAQGRVVGVDISSTILEVAKERYRDLANLRFEVGDAQTADLGEAEFDLVYSRFGVMFFQDVIAAFANLRRSLKPSGRLRFLCWRKPDENPWMQQPVSAIQEIFPPPPHANSEAPDPTAPGPFAFAQPERIHHILHASGFTQVRVDALDEYMRMGSVNDSITLILGIMGPSATEMSLATHEQVSDLHDAIRRIVESYDTANGVAIPCAAWMVSASV